MCVYTYIHIHTHTQYNKCLCACACMHACVDNVNIYKFTCNLMDSAYKILLVFLLTLTNIKYLACYTAYSNAYKNMYTDESFLTIYCKFSYVLFLVVQTGYYQCDCGHSNWLLPIIINYLCENGHSDWLLPITGYCQYEYVIQTRSGSYFTDLCLQSSNVITALEIFRSGYCYR